MIFDSSAWIEYFSGSETGQLAKSYVDSDEPIYTATISLMEIKGKYMREKKNWKGSIDFIMDRSAIVALDGDLALLAADVKHEHGLHATDAIVYATGQATGSKLLAKDAHFKGLKNVVMLE